MKELVTLIKHKEFAKAKRLLKKALQTDPDNVYLLILIERQRQRKRWKSTLLAGEKVWRVISP